VVCGAGVSLKQSDHQRDWTTMPIFDYQCKDCGKTYDVLHKVREVEEDIVCPSCSSRNAQRLISSPNFSLSGKVSSSSHAPESSAGCCCGGACDVN
jgi:putative FmdB family regulatory protein